MDRSRELDELLASTEGYLREKLLKIRVSEETLAALLDIAIKDIMIAADHIDCPYCRRHMQLEAEELRRVLSWIELEGNKDHKHSLRERFRTLWVSLKIFYYIILGGLRRAGIT